MMKPVSRGREPPNMPPLHEVRCRGCSRLLCRSDGRGTIEVKCPKCGYTNTWTDADDESNEAQSR